MVSQTYASQLVNAPGNVGNLYWSYTFSCQLVKEKSIYFVRYKYENLFNGVEFCIFYKRESRCQLFRSIPESSHQRVMTLRYSWMDSSEW